MSEGFLRASRRLGRWTGRGLCYGLIWLGLTLLAAAGLAWWNGRDRLPDWLD